MAFCGRKKMRLSGRIPGFFERLFTRVLRGVPGWASSWRRKRREWRAGEQDGLVRLFLQLATHNWQLATGIGWLVSTTDWSACSFNWQLATGNSQLAVDCSAWADWETYHTDRFLAPKCCQCCHIIGAIRLAAGANVRKYGSQ